MHTFCGSCLQEWRKSSTAAPCPLCRIPSRRAIVVQALPKDNTAKELAFARAFALTNSADLSDGSEDGLNNGNGTLSEQIDSTSLQLPPISPIGSFHQDDRFLPYISQLPSRRIFFNLSAEREIRQVQNRRRRILMQQRRLEAYTRRWVSIQHMVVTADSRVDEAHASGVPGRLARSLQDYAAAVRASVCLLKSALYDARTQLMDARASVVEANAALQEAQQAASAASALFGARYDDVFHSSQSWHTQEEPRFAGEDANQSLSMRPIGRPATANAMLSEVPIQPRAPILLSVMEASQRSSYFSASDQPSPHNFYNVQGSNSRINASILRIIDANNEVLRAENGFAFVTSRVNALEQCKSTSGVQILC